jgi:hypothetical protein
VVPAWMAYTTIGVMETLARWFGFRPILSVSQLDFVTKGDEPLANRAQQVLGWAPRGANAGLDAGVKQYLSERSANTLSA